MALAMEDGYMMEDVMLDLETLDTAITAAVISLGAVFFDKDRVGHTFYRVLDVEDQQAAGRTVNQKTMEWWAQQSEAARKVFLAEPTPTRVVLAEFAEFLGDRNIKVWGNGADFDCSITGSLYDTFKVKRPWSYSNNRCFRTLKNVALAHGSHDLPQREGAHHNALDDAIYQARMAGRYMKGTMKWA